MSRTSILICTFLLLVTTSCTREVEVSCSKSLSTIRTYIAILHTLGIQGKSVETQAGACIHVPRRDVTYSAGIIAKLHVYTQEEQESQTDLVKQFVPVLQSARDKINVEIQKIRDVLGVVKIVCDTQSQMNCSVWYHGKIVSEDELNSMLPLVLRRGSVFTDIQKNLDGYLVQAAQNQTQGAKVVVLEPFTFHVPIAEKDIAGIQLILVLGVFLVSGFVIGFWFGSKDRRSVHEK